MASCPVRACELPSERRGCVWHSRPLGRPGHLLLSPHATQPDPSFKAQALASLHGTYMNRAEPETGAGSGRLRLYLPRS